MNKVLQSKIGLIKKSKEGLYSVKLRELDHTLRNKDLNTLKMDLVDCFQRAREGIVIAGKFDGLAYNIARVHVTKTRSVLPFVNSEALCSR